MKLLIVVAMFAFVAVKISHAAPVPEEGKKEEAAPVPKVAIEATPSAAPAVAEVKSIPEASSDATLAPASAETPASAA